MTEIQKGQTQIETTDVHSVGKKQSSKLVKTVTLVVAVFVIITMVKFLGRQVGRQAAMQSIEREAIAQNALISFTGAKWFMSLSEAKSLFPDAIEFPPGDLKFEITAFSRPAFVDLMFHENLLYMVLITFKEDKTENAYKKTQNQIVQEYGTFPEPTTTAEQKLMSKKNIGKIAIEHVLYELLGVVPIEQVIFYSTKIVASD